MSITLETTTLPRDAATTDPMAALILLRRWLAHVIGAEASAWLDQEIDRQLAGLDERRLGIALGLSARKLGRRALDLPPSELAAAEGLRPGWQPQFWSTDEAARIALLLATHHGDDEAFAMLFEKLCVTAEINEHVSYMKGLAIFPVGTRLLGRAREGVRSSIAPVFEAVACRNPHPRDQMVVKCVFGGTPIGTIVGLHERRNADLLGMLRDLASERHAAGRVLPKEVHDFIAEEA
jgi:hypothetical protein